MPGQQCGDCFEGSEDIGSWKTLAGVALQAKVTWQRDQSPTAKSCAGRGRGAAGDRGFASLAEDRIVGNPSPSASRRQGDQL